MEAVLAVVIGGLHAAAIYMCIVSARVRQIGAPR